MQWRETGEAEMLSSLGLIMEKINIETKWHFIKKLRILRS
jgi:hypothetical protein